MVSGTRELAHVFVKRVSGTVETEDQGAAPASRLWLSGLGVDVLRVGGPRVRDPFTLMLEGRLANKARVYGRAQETIVGLDRRWSGQGDEGILGECIEQRGGRHVGGWGKRAKWEGL